MSKILSLGAINKLTGQYVYPKIANKKEEYICPNCNKDVFPRQGKIIRHHYAHKRTDNPCNYYNNPGETQIHKDGKMLLKHLLETKILLSFIRKCTSCKKNEIFGIPEITEHSSIQIEYRFEYNDSVKIADVAYIDDKVIKYIFEICNTHKTCSENRPEPWFEIDAITLINMVNDIKFTSFEIPCIRCEKCEKCIVKENINVQKSIDIFLEWFDNDRSKSINPFICRDFDEICEDEDFGLFDLVIYDKGNIKYGFNFKHIIYSKKNLEDCFDMGINIYYIDTNWILQQTKIPSYIQCIKKNTTCHDDINDKVYDFSII
jgi:hypothetical protein